MKTSHTLCAALAALTLASCTGSQLAGTAVGSSLGAVFGSSIGGIAGGPRGADIGRAVGMVAGGAAGAAATAPRTESGETEHRTARSSEPDGYGSYAPARPGATPQSAWDYIEVSNVRFVDANGNRRLDPDETAYIEFEMYNRSDHTLRDVAPRISCTNRHVTISPPAVVASMPPGGGIRYKAAVRAPRRLRSGREIGFSIAFGSGSEAVTARSFTLRTAP